MAKGKKLEDEAKDKEQKEDQGEQEEEEITEIRGRLEENEYQN